MTTNHQQSMENRKTNNLLVLMIVVLIVIALALMQSLAGASQNLTMHTNTVTPTVAKDQQAVTAAVAVSSSAPSDSVTVLTESAQRVAGVFDAQSAVTKQAVTFAKTVTQATQVTKPATLAQTVRSFFSVVGKPKDGQVLMYINGRLEWHDLAYAAANGSSSDGSVHISGAGRKPLTYPLNANQILHSAAGDVPLDRHVGGGGGASGGTSGGSTTVINNYTTNNTTSGSGGSAATFIGTTPVTTYNGSFTSGGKVGYDAGNTICAAAFTSSHMCSADEILGTIANKNISTLFSGVPDAWISQGPPGYTADSNDCHGFTSANLAYLGPWWHFDTAGGGIGYLTNCSTTKPIACCKPQ